jgi:hypothetical protein
VLGRDGLTDAVIEFVSLRNALAISVTYLLIVAIYLAEELGVFTFRSKRLEAWCSRLTLGLFAVSSPAFMVLAMVFSFMWGFGR